MLLFILFPFASSGGTNRTYGLRVQSPASLPTATTPEWERKERELNPQGIAARPFSGRLPSPVGLPFRFPSPRSLDGWIRTSVVRLPKPADWTRSPTSRVKRSSASIDPPPRKRFTGNRCPVSEPEASATWATPPADRRWRFRLRNSE